MEGIYSWRGNPAEPPNVPKTRRIQEPTVSPATPVSELAIGVEPGVREYSRAGWFRAAPLAVLVVYLGVWACTLAHFMGDTNVYAQAILRHKYGLSGDYHLTTSNPFWDFGHLLWRPLGWLCFEIAQPATRLLTHYNQRAEVLLTLIGVTFLAALVCVGFFFLLARRILGDDWAAFLATVGFFSADAFLNYVHTGNAYVVAMTCMIAGMYFTMPDKSQIASLGKASLAGIFFALAVLFWFPYVFVLPAAMAAPLLLRGHERQRLRSVEQTLGVCIVVGLVAYTSAIAVVGIRNITDLRAWVLAAGHGQIQASGWRAAARLAFSLPRSFINMGRDGIWLKRYLVHDPYAQVKAADVLRLSLWKLVLFYTAAGIVCFELVHSQRWRMLVLLASAVLPIVVFGVFVFQAGSIDLYLPLYPFVALAFAYVLGNEQTHSLSKIVLFAALTVMIAVNINAMSKGTLNVSKARAETRIHDLIPLLKPNDMVMTVNEQDNVAEFRLNYPLDPINADHEWQSYDVLEINASRLATWRGDFAMRALATWQQRGAVWLPERFFHATPRTEWNWVEGDDKRVKWTDLPSFFSQLETGPMVDGDDGFVMLQDGAKNRQILGAISQRIAGNAI